MRLLLVSDVPSGFLWDHYRPEHVEGVSLILSAGDLKRGYLDFLVTMTAKPLVYVPGNHDRAYVKDPPGGCVNADGCVLTVAPPGGSELRIAGLGGCQGGNPKEPYEYTEKAMTRRVKKLLSKVQRAGGIDIFLTHAPVLGVGDGDDAFHKGFACFRDFIGQTRPRWHVYGHQHKSYKPMQAMETMTGETRHINACGHRILEW